FARKIPETSFKASGIFCIAQRYACLPAHGCAAVRLCIHSLPDAVGFFVRIEFAAVNFLFFQVDRTVKNGILYFEIVGAAYGETYFFFIIKFLIIMIND
ncbi:MAG: hypothetical protein ACOCNJ_06820, partial [Bacteroidales bacterium]